MHDELAIFVEVGLSPLAALRAEILNPAEYLEMTKFFGTVKSGKIANLVLPDANPLEDIRNILKIQAVVLNVKCFDRQELDLY